MKVRPNSLKALRESAKARTAKAFSVQKQREGTRIGYFTLVQFTGALYPAPRFLVRDERCGHISETNIPVSKSNEFVGRKKLCGCPAHYLDGSGYMVWQWANQDGRQVNFREHRIVMESIIGRELYDHETVHHKNGDRADNRPENLQLMSGRHGKGVVHQCLDCGSQNIASVPIADAA